MDTLQLRRGMNRRKFVSMSALATAALLEGGLAHAVEKKRPNILFCLADDWGMDHASIYGDPVVKTPTFDCVARDGVLFYNTFCPAPTCTASRSAMLTGQAPHRLENGANLYGLPAGKVSGVPRPAGSFGV
jgi:arylsulfatase A-like enzyme